MLNKDELTYLGGLIDGEVYIGVTMWKDLNATFGYAVRPVFQIALGFPDSLCLEYFHRETGLGKIVPNKKSGHGWLIRTKKEVIQILDLVEGYVRFPSTQKKIKLVKEFLSIMPNNRPCTINIWIRELEIMSELRKMSKRKKNRTRFNVDELLARFSLKGEAKEAVRGNGESLILRSRCLSGDSSPEELPEPTFPLSATLPQQRLY